MKKAEKALLNKIFRESGEWFFKSFSHRERMAFREARRKGEIDMNDGFTQVNRYTILPIRKSLSESFFL